MNLVAVAADTSGYVVPTMSLLREACDVGLFLFAVGCLAAAVYTVFKAPRHGRRH